MIVFPGGLGWFRVSFKCKQARSTCWLSWCADEMKNINTDEIEMKSVGGDSGMTVCRLHDT